MIEKIQLLFYAMQDKRTPWYAKAMVIFTLAYIVSPIDIIPDFIPVIGLLDEVILIPIAYSVVMKLIPEQVKAEAIPVFPAGGNHYIIKIVGVLIVMIIWLTLILVVYNIFHV